MDENSNQAERDPWADMGNMSNSNPGELSEAAKENAEKWENAMSSDVPEYAGPFNPAEAENEPGRDESISDASAIINYGLNAASKQIGVEKTMETINFFVPNGEEDPFGYKGRVCIMEQLSVTEEIQKFIRGDVEDVNTDMIEKTARGLGMITLEQKGVLAALRGDTTIEEIGRVI